MMLCDIAVALVISSDTDTADDTISKNDISRWWLFWSDRWWYLQRMQSPEDAISRRCRWSSWRQRGPQAHAPSDVEDRESQRNPEAQYLDVAISRERNARWGYLQQWCLQGMIMTKSAAISRWCNLQRMQCSYLQLGVFPDDAVPHDAISRWCSVAISSWGVFPDDAAPDYAAIFRWWSLEENISRRWSVRIMKASEWYLNDASRE